MAKEAKRDRTTDELAAEQVREYSKLGTVSISCWGDAAGARKTRSASFGTGGPGGVPAAITAAIAGLQAWLDDYNTETRRAAADVQRKADGR